MHDSDIAFLAWTGLIAGLILVLLLLIFAVGEIRYLLVKRRASRVRELKHAAEVRVRNESKRLHGILSLHKFYYSKFSWDISPVEDFVSCSTRAQAEHYGETQLWKHVVEFVSSHKPDLLRRFELAKQNVDVNHHYVADRVQLESPTFDGELGAIEAKLCERYTLQPECEIHLIVHVTYVSPAGRSSYHQQYLIDQSQLVCAMAQGEKAISEQERRRQERAKVTPKLRYNVLKRDGFRCVRCGASASDGAKLHVDHIIPVSRGGKTEMSNLQTLCEACNLGKGADMPAGNDEG